MLTQTAKPESPALTLETRAAAHTLLDLAARHYHERPDAPAIIFIPPSGLVTEPHIISYRAFFDGAARYANALRETGIAPRDLVILVMEHSESLLYAFWGAMMLGAIPSIFPFLTDKLDPTLYYERVQALLGDKSKLATKEDIASIQQRLDALEQRMNPSGE